MSIISAISEDLFLAQEAYYHSLVYLTLRLLEFTIYAERITNIGRIDAVLELPDVIYFDRASRNIGEWKHEVSVPTQNT